MNRLWHVAYLTAILILGFLLHLAKPDSDYANFHTALLEKTHDYENVKWLGYPIWQPVMDLWSLQETISDVKPELIIECGTYKGGSALFFASLMDLMGGKGRVITVDIRKLHNLSHPRITFLIGDCASPEIVEQIQKERETIAGPVMVVLDSDHSAAHVTKELNAYCSFVTPGSYLHVQDGVIDVLPIYADERPGPLVAIDAFLKDHPEFEVDSKRETKFLITHHPKGWLRRK